MVNSVPFFRPSVGDAEVDAVSQAMRSGWLTTGPNAAAFEKEFSDQFSGEVFSVAVNSATSGLHLGLEALGVGPGDEVIVPTLTFTATAEVVRYLGATPVFIDVEDNFCMGVSAAAAAVTDKTKVIMPVHFAGRSCDMTSLRQLADKHGLKILADSAHALPTYHKGELIGGGLADINVFSFYANKTMTTGEGGMLTTRDPVIAKHVKMMRLHGIDRDVFNRFSDLKASWIYDVVAPGYKYNLTDMAAAMGRVQLSRCGEFFKARRAQFDRYNEALKDLPLILAPEAAKDDVHSCHLYIIQLSEEAALNRDELITALKSRNIGTSVHYRPLHQMTYWSTIAKGEFPIADGYFKRCVSIPLFMAMKEEEQTYVITALNDFLS